MKNKANVYIVAIIGSVFFGLTFLGAKIALTKLGATEVLACRWTLAFVLFCICVAFRIIKVDFRKKPVWAVAAMAVLQPCICCICETCGIDMTTTSESAIMYAMIPIAVVLISRIVLKQKISKVVATGIALSFAGVFVAIAFSEGFSLGGKAAGYLVLLGMVITGAIFIIISARISEIFTAMERTFIMAAAATICFNGLNLISGKGISGYIVCFTDLKIGLAILFLGAVGSFTCYILINYVLSKLPAAQVSCLQVNITSLTGVIAGILFQGDSFGWYTIAGMIMIVTGVIACNIPQISSKNRLLH